MDVETAAATEAVLSAASELASSLTLTMLDGSTVAATGSVAMLRETPGDVKQPWSRGGRHVWTYWTPRQSDVEFVTIEPPAPDYVAGKFRVTYREKVGSTSHYVLHREETL